MKSSTKMTVLQDLRRLIEWFPSRKIRYVEASFLSTLAARIEDLEAALSLALCGLIKHEPGDSRAVSDAFVALAAVEAGITDEACRKIIRDALVAENKAAERPLRT